MPAYLLANLPAYLQTCWPIFTLVVKEGSFSVIGEQGSRESRKNGQLGQMGSRNSRDIWAAGVAGPQLDRNQLSPNLQWASN